METAGVHDGQTSGIWDLEHCKLGLCSYYYTGLQAGGETENDGQVELEGGISRQIGGALEEGNASLLPADVQQVREGLIHQTTVEFG